MFVVLVSNQYCISVDQVWNKQHRLGKR